MGEGLDRDEVWREEIGRRLVRLEGLLSQVVGLLAVRLERPGHVEPGAAPGESPEHAELLFPTWILDDQLVAQIEQAVVQESRVRGQAYGG